MHTYKHADYIHILHRYNVRKAQCSEYVHRKYTKYITAIQSTVSGVDRVMQPVRVLCLVWTGSCSQSECCVWCGQGHAASQSAVSDVDRVMQPVRVLCLVWTGSCSQSECCVWCGQGHAASQSAVSDVDRVMQPVRVLCLMWTGSCSQSECCV